MKLTIKNVIVGVLILLCFGTLMACGADESSGDDVTDVTPPALMEQDSVEEKINETSVDNNATTCETESSLMESSANSTVTISLENFLKTAMLPVGKTLYIWGGGWNEEDTGAGVEALTKGISLEWEEFFETQGPNYNNLDYEYQIHKGLDCSGYIGWLMYNVFENQYSDTGYVMKASTMAKTFADWKLGTYTEVTNVKDWKPGDIMSKSDHVWICLGTCEDNSVLLMHSSEPGVRICGTKNPDGSESMAMKLAKEYTSKYYPKWHEKYPTYGVGLAYLQQSNQMRWNTDTFEDAKAIQSMTPDEVLELMFSEE